MKNESNKPIQRLVLNAVIDVMVALHGKKVAQEKIRNWAAAHRLTSWAQLRLYDFLAEKDT